MFKFRLEPALRYRTSIVEKNQRELAAVNNVLQREKDNLENLMSKRKKNSEKYHFELENLSPEEMVFYDNYFSGNLIAIEKQKLAVANAQKTVDKKIAVLNESVKQKRIIETVKKKVYAEYLQLEKKKEEALLNEIVSTRFKNEQIL